MAWPLHYLLGPRKPAHVTVDDDAVQAVVGKRQPVLNQTA